MLTTMTLPSTPQKENVQGKTNHILLRDLELNEISQKEKVLSFKSLQWHHLGETALHPSAMLVPILDDSLFEPSLIL